MGYRGLPKRTVSDGSTFRSLLANTVRLGYKVSQKVYHTNTVPKISLRLASASTWAVKAE